MSSNKNVYEVLDDFKKATTKIDRINVLKQNETYALRSILKGALDPKIVFNVDPVPEYRHDKDVPAGLGYSNLTDEFGRIYLFIKDHPRAPPALTDERRSQILIQILEALEEREAEVFANMLRKDLKVPYLTTNLVNEAFPDLL